MTDTELKQDRSLPLAPLAYLLVVFICAFVWSPLALKTFIIESWVPLLICAGATGYGGLIFEVIGIKFDEVSSRLLMACVMGFGFIAILMLGIGLAGFVTFYAAWALLIPGLVLLPVVFRKDFTEFRFPKRDINLLWWLPTAIMLGFAITVATLPPGMIWPEEGAGYDVLEYHLGGPKEYIENGRISYLPHNVYTNFPFNVEMLYMLAMLLRGGPIEGMFAAKLVNVALAVLAVLAIRDAGRQINPDVGRFAAISLGSVPFITYLCGVAYVENGMLMFTAAAMSMCLRALGTANDEPKGLLLAGLLTGFACGCKYPAVPMLALPLGAFLLIGLAKKRIAFFSLLMFGIGIAVACGPWLIKNSAFTKNPVFPLAGNVLQGEPPGWNEASHQQWEKGHDVPDHAKLIPARLNQMKAQILGSWKQGLTISFAIICGVILFLRRESWKPRNVSIVDENGGNPQRENRSFADAIVLSLVLIASNLYVWFFHTHVIDRFAVGMLPPAVLLIGMFVIGNHGVRLAGRLSLVIILAIQVYSMVGHMRQDNIQHMDALDAFGNATVVHDFVPHYSSINDKATPAHRVLLIGDARKFYYNQNVSYCVVFNRNPFAEAASVSDKDAIQWLRENKYQYVCVNWSEMTRLRKSYGFWPSITNELFERLVGHGLEPIEGYQFDESSGVYATLYEVTQN